MKRYFNLLFLVLAFSTVGCSSSSGNPVSELEITGNAASSYLVKSGDSLNIQVWGEPRLSGEVVVLPKGTFHMQLINDVIAAGKTTEEIGQDVSDRLEAFVPGASVTVSLIGSAPIRYYLDGSFVHPGEYRSDANINLLQAISTGGGFAPFADESNIILIRQTTSGEKRYSLDYNRVRLGKLPNPILKDGDVISVK